MQWAYPDTAALAERICELSAKSPQPLDSLWRRLTCSSLTYLQVVGELLTTDQAEVLPLESAESAKPVETSQFKI